MGAHGYRQQAVNNETTEAKKCNFVNKSYVKCNFGPSPQVVTSLLIDETNTAPFAESTIGESSHY